MSPRRTAAVGAATGSDGGLLLPRPPGVMRRFWSRHPRLFDVLLALLALLLSVPTVALRSPTSTDPPAAVVWLGVAMTVVGGVALVLRRGRPILVFVIAVAPTVVLPPALTPIGHLLLAFALYAVAVYRSARACWIALGAAAVAIAASAAVGAWLGLETWGVSIGNVVAATVSMLIGALIGVNVGARRRYLDALIDRSRQLLVERDQQAQLAAAAERTRIAREMHDIVSHSLTVVVALSEGAAAAVTADRAREASRMAATTARDALQEMRAMLGVLRDGADSFEPLEPLEPVEPSAVVDAAQRAGYPVHARMTGDVTGLPRSVRFALGRVVQEALTNAMRHAPGATEIALAVDVDADAVRVSVRNDGARARADAPGFGLRGIRERVDIVGGTLDAGPSGRAGEWMLRATLPLSPAVRRDAPADDTPTTEASP
jgi:signal transduction histidine kinase